MMLWAALAAVGCDETRECVYEGQTLAVGASVDDIPRRLRCTCTAAGIACEDLPGAVALLDAEPPDAAPAADARSEPEPDAAPDAAPVVDALPPDAAPPRCPERRIGDGSDCFTEGLVCAEGPAFDCCGRPFPAERNCVCDGGLWTCTDLVAVCEEDPEIGECGRRSRLCERWLATRSLTDPTELWNGDHDACDAGVMNADWRDAVLERINTLRAMAGLDPVDHSPNLDALAQECALAIVFHGTGDHQLEEFDQCYSRTAEEGVASSLIAQAPGLVAIDQYMLDFGEQNFDSMTHRLYLLAPQLGPIGIGSTPLASCVQVHGSRGQRNDPEWVAWPPPGPFPIDADYTNPAGWTVHSNVLNLAFAEVEVTLDGEVLPIEQRDLDTAGPAGWGTAWLPVDWALEAGRSYRVVVRNALRRGERVEFSYTVQPVSCAEP